MAKRLRGISLTPRSKKLLTVGLLGGAAWGLFRVFQGKPFAPPSLPVLGPILNKATGSATTSSASTSAPSPITVAQQNAVANPSRFSKFATGGPRIAGFSISGYSSNSGGWR